MDFAEFRDELKGMQPRPVVLAAWLAVAAAFLMAYGATLGNLAHVWWTMPDYGHGFFVPVFSLVLLWSRRDMVKPWPQEGSWWGLAFFGLFGAFVLASVYFPYATPRRRRDWDARRNAGSPRTIPAVVYGRFPHRAGCGCWPQATR